MEIGSHVSIFLNNNEKKDSNEFQDDIECKKWLSEVDLPQYTDTFLTNFGIGGNLLSRKRLNTVRLQDFPAMNITDYEHAKLLLELIRITMRFSFDSSDRTREVRTASSSRGRYQSSISLPPITQKEYILPSKLADVHVAYAEQTRRKANHERYISSRRRKAFDNKLWNSINKLRDDNPNAIRHLREGNISPMSGKNVNIKKFQFEHEKDVIESPRSVSKSVYSKGKEYGDTALNYDMALNQLKLLQTENLALCRNLVNCEVANIFLVNSKTHELMLYVDEKWFKMPITVGIAGYVARTGEIVNIPDAYADDRFNRHMDKKTGFKTRNILCQAIRSNHGGHVIAVIQTINKRNGESFGADDETVVDTCVQKLSEDLELRFQDLLRLSDRLGGIAHSVGPK